MAHQEDFWAAVTDFKVRALQWAEANMNYSFREFYMRSQATESSKLS